jgi:YVTN family beta-propeller protein
MDSNNRNGNRAASARGFMALFAIVLAMGVGLAACPAEAAPFLYVANSGDNTVSVIDTANRAVVATVIVNSPFGVAVSPNGQDVYVSKVGNNKVRVIATATNTKVAAIPVGRNPTGVAIGP